MKFSSFEVKEGSKMNTYGQFEVVDVAWADRLGTKQHIWSAAPAASAAHINCTLVHQVHQHLCQLVRQQDLGFTPLTSCPLTGNTQPRAVLGLDWPQAVSSLLNSNSMTSSSWKQHGGSRRVASSCVVSCLAGSATLDAVLMEHFAKEFDERHMQGKGSVLDQPRAVAKLRKQVPCRTLLPAFAILKPWTILMAPPLRPSNRPCLHVRPAHQATHKLPVVAGSSHCRASSCSR